MFKGFYSFCLHINLNFYDFILRDLRNVINLQPILSHGVMVTLRFLVPSFKVRVLVGQQLNPDSLTESGFFIFKSFAFAKAKYYGFNTKTCGLCKKD